MKLHEAIAVTYAAMGQELTDAALTVITNDLKVFPLPGVLAALQRCRKELRRIALADILERIPGGHPGVEEAWSIVAPTLTDERITVVWTAQMSEAFGRALDLADDPVAARMAFKEVYTRLLAVARDAGAAPKWVASLGQDPAGREGPLLAAIEKGRLAAPYVQKLLPHLEVPAPAVLALIESSGAANWPDKAA